MSQTWIVNAKLIMPSGIVPGSLVWEDGRIGDVFPNQPMPEAAQGKSRYDAKGQYLCPGFIEMHTHGAGGADFMDGSLEAIVTASRTHLRHGITTLVPTTLTCAPDELLRTIRLFKAAQRLHEQMPNLLGLHLEGPYFSMNQCGAQDPAYIKAPDAAEYTHMLDEADGCIKRWSVAVELPGAMEMGDVLVQNGVLPSIGHSDAQFIHVKEAIHHGYTHVTHLYSAMSTITREKGFRKLGVLESAFVLDELTVEIIADGCHLPPELLRFVWRCKGRDKTCLITDSMRCAGQDVTTSILGSLEKGQTVIIEDGVAKLPDRTAFASSIATADRLLKVMWKEAQIPLEDCVYMLTAAPAKVMGVENRKGKLEKGYDADLLLLDEALNVQKVFVSGQKQFDAADGNA